MVTNSVVLSRSWLLAHKSGINVWKKSKQQSTLFTMKLGDFIAGQLVCDGCVINRRTLNNNLLGVVQFIFMRT